MGRQDDINFILKFIEDPNNARAVASMTNQVETLNAGFTQTATGKYKNPQGQWASKEDAVNAQATAAAVQDQANAYAEVQQTLHGVVEEQKAQTEEVKRTGVAVTGIMGYTLVRVGHQFSDFAKQIISPFQSFIKDAGMYEGMSIRSNAVTRDLGSSWERIGRIMADTIVPAEEQAAKLVRELADFVEAHPEVAKIAIGVSAGFAIMGSLAVTLGTLLNAMAAIRILGKVFMPGLAAGAGAAAAEGAAGAGAGAGILAALSPLLGPIAIVLGGILAAMLVANAITNATGRPSVGTSAGRVVTMGGATAWGAISELFHPGTAATAFSSAFEWLGKLTGVLPKVAAGATVATQGLTDFASKLYNSPAKGAILEAFKQYEKDVAQAGIDHASKLVDAQKSANEKVLASDKEYNAKREEMVAQFAADAVAALADYNLSMDREMRDFQQNEADAEADYYDQRMKAARKAGEEEAKDEAAFQLKMKRMAEDHNDTMWDLAGKRDAGAMIQEMRRYEKERTRAEEDHNLEVAQRHHDFAQQLSDMADNFKKQRDRRLRDFEQRRADEAADFAAQQKKTAEENAKKLLDLDTAHTDELTKIKQDLADQNAAIDKAYKDQLDSLQTAIIDRINILDPFLLKTQAQLDADVLAEFTRFVTWMNAIMAGKAPPASYPTRRKAIGGDWITSGPEHLLVGESGMERVTITPMPHGITDLASMMLARGGGSTSQSKMLTVNDQRRFYNGISNEERRAIKKDTLATLQEVLG